MLKTIKLGQLIASQTKLARRDILALLTDNKITVNGVIAESLTAEISIKKDEVLVEGVPVSFQIPFRYYKFYKPKDVLCTLEDPKGRACIADYIKHLEPSLFPVGRLDRQTTGLLIITNDGAWANILTHPSYEVNKMYDVELDHPLTKNDTRRLQTGLFLEDGPVQFQQINMLGKDKLRVTLTEGRNRIIRRTFEFLGYKVTKLNRLSVGPIQLGKLQKGDIKPLSKGEVTSLSVLTKSAES
jgi:23S rRNA pseudouridine2605 synthase